MIEYLPEIFKPQGLRTISRLALYVDFIKTEKTIYWNYGTYGDQIETDYNAGCWDVSKDKIHDVHERVAGYSAKVDPVRQKAPFLEKSTHQGRHDCKVRRGNCEPEPERVYELLMDNTFEIRYMLCRPGQDFLFEKVREKNDFSMGYISAKVQTDIDPELQLFVRAFAAEYRLHFAELDILYHENRPYIIDVNNIAGCWRLFAKCDEPKFAKELYIKQVKSL